MVRGSIPRDTLFVSLGWPDSEVVKRGRLKICSFGFAGSNPALASLLCHLKVGGSIPPSLIYTMGGIAQSGERQTEVCPGNAGPTTLTLERDRSLAIWQAQNLAQLGRAQDSYS